MTPIFPTAPPPLSRDDNALFPRGQEDVAAIELRNNRLEVAVRNSTALLKLLGSLLQALDLHGDSETILDNAEFGNRRSPPKPLPPSRGPFAFAFTPQVSLSSRLSPTGSAFLSSVLPPLQPSFPRSKPLPALPLPRQSREAESLRHCPCADSTLHHCIQTDPPPPQRYLERVLDSAWELHATLQYLSPSSPSSLSDGILRMRAVRERRAHLASNAHNFVLCASKFIAGQFHESCWNPFPPSLAVKISGMRRRGRRENSWR